MSDSELELFQRGSEVSEPASEAGSDGDDYGERVELMRKLKKRSQIEIEDHQMDAPEDLAELQQKIKNRQEKKKDKAKVEKRFVPVSQLRTTFLIHLMKLYQQTKQLYDEEELAKCLSLFSYEQLVRLRHEVAQESTELGRLKRILLVFQIDFSSRAASPDEYQIRFALLCRHFGLEVRIVRGFDFGFLGLDSKFRIKCLSKEEQSAKSSAEKQVNITVLNSSYLLNEDQAVESLQSYRYLDKKRAKQSTMANEEPAQQTMIQSEKVNQKAKEKIKATGEGQEDSRTQLIAKQKKYSKQNNTELQDLNKFIWLEILIDGEWKPLDIISDQIVSLSINQLKQKLHQSYVYYIMSMYKIDFVNQDLECLFDNRVFGKHYFCDVTERYVPVYTMPRTTLLLTSFYKSIKYRYQFLYYGLPTLVKQQAQIQADQKRPDLSTLKTEASFKFSKHYALASQLIQYLMVKPGSVPVGKFGDQDVYLRSDVTILHTKDKWRAYLRLVKADAVSIKEVTGRFDKSKITQLYAEWQTEDLKVSLVDNGGKLPSNQYGNYETFAFPPPKGTKLLRILGIKQVLQKNNIPFVEAVDSFDSKSSKMFAVKCGYLLYEEDYDKALALAEESKAQQAIKNREKKRKEIMKLWNELFKAILTKRDIQIKYQQQQN